MGEQAKATMSKSRKRKTRTIALLGIAALAVCGLETLYEIGNSHYQKAMSDIKKADFTDAKEQLQAAHKDSVFFFGNWQKNYSNAVESYGDYQLQAAENAMLNGQFTKINGWLQHIPRSFSNYKEVQQVSAENPLNFNVQKVIGPNILIDSKQYTMMYGKSPVNMIPAVIVTGHDVAETLNRGYAFVYLYDKSEGKYILAYQQAQLATTYTSVAGKLFGNQDPRTAVAIVENDEGSGGYAGATVLGIPSTGTDKLMQYLSVTPNPDSAFKIVDGKLLNEYAGLAEQYTWNGSDFIGQQVQEQAPTSKGDTTVHYSIQPHDQTTVNPSTVTVNVGQKIDLIRDDHNQVTERTLLDGQSVLNFVNGQENQFVAEAPGTTTITIVPDGYDWNNAQKIQVIVTK